MGAATARRPKFLRIRLRPVKDFTTTVPHNYPLSSGHPPSVRRGGSEGPRYETRPRPSNDRVIEPDREGHAGLSHPLSRPRQGQFGRMRRSARAGRRLRAFRRRGPSRRTISFLSVPDATVATYLSSTVAPASSSFFLISSASSFLTPSLTVLGADSTRVLGLLEAKGGDGADLFDDVDLLFAEGGQDDLELGLFLGRLGTPARRPARRRRPPGRRRKRPIYPPTTYSAPPPRGR